MKVSSTSPHETPAQTATSVEDSGNMNMSADIKANSPSEIKRWVKQNLISNLINFKQVKKPSKTDTVTTCVNKMNMKIMFTSPCKKKLEEMAITLQQSGYQMQEVLDTVETFGQKFLERFVMLLIKLHQIGKDVWPINWDEYLKVQPH
ncbi:MAG: hypothetical protein ACR2IQ_01490 [Minisyncoccia bacterium]